MVQGDPQLEKLFNDFVEYSHRYVADVADMQELQYRKKTGEIDREQWKEEFEQADRDRTVLHDALIDSIAILARNMRKKELSDDWIKPLVTGSTFNRATCGLFAHMIAFQSGKEGDSNE